jgi:hypothetical protein
LEISAESEFQGMQGLAIYVLLHRWFDDDAGEPRRFTVGSPATFEWGNLTAGVYYLEIFHPHMVPVTGTVAVNVR